MTLGQADFAGRWQIIRRIADRLGPDGKFVGTADLVPTGDHALHYSEIGRLMLVGSLPMTATRQYLWRFKRGRVFVAFASGGPFHTFRPAGKADGTDHPCGADYYRVRYDFRDWPRWQAEWTVKGPRKDYTSVSDYARSISVQRSGARTIDVDR